MPKVNKKIDYLKCSQCRKDRQKCLPKGRKWPEERCVRCEKYGYQCSENRTKTEELGSQNEVEELGSQHGVEEPGGNQHAANLEPGHGTTPPDAGYGRRYRNTIEATLDNPVDSDKVSGAVTACDWIEELAYLKWLWDRLEPEAQLLKSLGYTDGYRHELLGANCRLSRADDFIQDFKSVYQDALHSATMLAVSSYGKGLIPYIKTLDQHILSCPKEFRPTSQIHTSLLSKMVDYHQDKGDFLAAQQIQEQLLAALTEDIHKSGGANGTTRATQRLIELYKKSLNRLCTIAGRLGLDVEMCLRVVPLLHQAVSQNNGVLISAVISELKRHDSLEIPDFLGRTVVHYAIERHGIESLRCLSRGRGYSDNRDYIGRTALQIAAAQGNREIMQLLASNRADANYRMDGCERILSQVAAGGWRLEIVKLLLSSGVDNATSLWDRTTALQAAVGSGNLEILKLLLSSGADADAPAGRYGRTALQWAIESGHLEIVRLLLLSGRTSILAGMGQQHSRQR